MVVNPVYQYSGIRDTTLRRQSKELPFFDRPADPHFLPENFGTEAYTFSHSNPAAAGCNSDFAQYSHTPSLWDGFDFADRYQSGFLSRRDNRTEPGVLT